MEDQDWKDKYLKLADAVRCVIESYDYMAIGFRSTVSWRMSTCTHGNFMHRGCESCIDDFLGEALGQTTIIETISEE
jgi:hypothetical protein